MALSRLGMLYHNILKNKERAKDYLMKCNELAAAMHPKMFYTEGMLRHVSGVLISKIPTIDLKDGKIELKPQLNYNRDES